MNDIECCGNTFCKSVKHPLMDGSGNENADIMILGESPGPDEDAVGSPFVGKAGRFLRQRMLPGAGIREADVYFTNVVRCFPGRNKKGAIRNPMANDIRRCRPNLLDTVKKVNPKVIIAMGNAALHGCLGLARWKDDEKKKDTAVTGIAKWRGTRVWHPEFDCWVIFTYHPSFLMRQFQFEKFQYNQAMSDLELAFDSVNLKKVSDRYIDNTCALLVDPESAAKYIGDLSSYSEVAVDTETTTMDFREADRLGTKALLGVSLSTDKEVCVDGTPVKSAYIPVNTLLTESVRGSFQSFLLKGQVTKVWHNVAFDERILTSAGFEFGDIDNYNHICTMMAAKLMDENFSVGLKELTWRFLSIGGYEKPLDDYRREHKMSGMAGAPSRTIAKYAAMDTLATIRLWKYVLKPGLQQEGLYNLFIKVLTKARMIFTTFEQHGVRVDSKRAKALSSKCGQIREQLSQRLFKIAGKEININSYPQIRNVLFGELKATPLAKTKTGQASTEAKFMKKMLTLSKTPKRAKAFIQTLSDIKYIDKQVSTYIDKIGKVVWEDGRVHTRFNLTGTVTGRPSSSDPNIANIPKDGLIRSLYIASEGNVLLECDMSSAELRVLAAYSQEPVLVKAFQEGKDLHEATYRTLFDKPDSYKPRADERKKGKTVNFGAIYGIGPPKLADDLGISEKEAEAFINLYFRKLPRVAQWLDDNAKHGQSKGYVVSFFKRKRRIPELRSDSLKDKSEAIRQANNAVIQSCASDLCFIGIVRAYKLMKKAGLKAKMIHSVYDSVLIDTPEDEVPKLKEILTKSFETPIKGVPDFMMKVDFEVDSRWGRNYPSKLAEVLKMVPWNERKATN